MFGQERKKGQRKMHNGEKRQKQMTSTEKRKRKKINEMNGKEKPREFDEREW